ncbi:MAG: LptE family protein [Balneolaceae bacterium]|nr:LptE family protein [Balneolaceae bacterium]
MPHTRMRAGAPRVFASAAGSSSPPWHRASRILGVLILSVTLFFGGCFSYSFTGTSIPEGVNTIYIPFFADQSTSGIADLSDQLNRFLVNRFVNQTRLQLANSRGEADAILEGQITSYSNRPFSVTSDEETDQNQVTISVRATYQYTSEDQPEWNQQFSGSSTYDPNENPIEGEQTAAAEALEQVVNNMFNDAVSDW